jgi:hypothetical protein
MLFGTNRSFRRGTLQSDCLSSQPFVVVFANISLSFFFLLIGVNTADDIALELIHDDVESPILNRNSEEWSLVYSCVMRSSTVKFVSSSVID